MRKIILFATLWLTAASACHLIPKGAESALQLSKLKIVAVKTAEAAELKTMSPLCVAPYQRLRMTWVELVVSQNALLKLFSAQVIGTGGNL